MINTAASIPPFFHCFSYLLPHSPPPLILDLYHLSSRPGLNYRRHHYRRISLGPTKYSLSRMGAELSEQEKTIDVEGAAGAVPALPRSRAGSHSEGSDLTEKAQIDVGRPADDGVACIDPHADEALRVLARAGPLEEVTAQEKRRLVRKIDLHVLPMLLVIYFTQYLDKSSLSYAAALGIKTSIPSLKVGDHFNVVATLFFVGQAVGEFPTIRLMQLFPLRGYVTANVVLWGVIVAAQAGCTSYGGMLAARFFLGLTEATVVPAWVIYTSQWYTREEQAFRVGLWFASCGLSQILGGSVAYGIAEHVGKDPHATLAGWQICFIIFGIMAALFGVLFYVALPNSPADAWFLSDREKAIHIERIRRNEQGIGSRHFEWSQCREALLDPFTWLYSFWTFAANIPNSLATSFGTTLIMGLGYSANQSLILATPLGAIEVVALVGLTYLASRTERRILWCLVGHIPGFVGAVLMATSGKVPALIGFYLTGAIPIGWTTILGLTASNVGGSSKKITVSAIQTVAYTIGVRPPS